MLGRVGSAARVLTYGLNPLTLLLGGWLTDRLGERSVLLGIGGAVVLVALSFAASSSLRKPLLGATGAPAP